VTGLAELRKKKKIVNLHYFEVQTSIYFFRNLLSIGKAYTSKKIRPEFLV
jgi:hypothetical protein